MFCANIYFHKSEHSGINNILLTEPNENNYRTEFSEWKKGKKVVLWLIKLALKCIKGTTGLLHSHGKQHLLLVILAFNTVNMIISNSKSHIQSFNLCFQYKCGEGGLQHKCCYIQDLVQYLVLAMEPSCCCSWMSSASCFCKDISLPCTCLINGCSKRWVTEGRCSKSLIRHLWQRNRGLRQCYHYSMNWVSLLCACHSGGFFFHKFEFLNMLQDSSILQ